MERAELLAEFILQSDLIEGINDSRAQLEEEIRAGKSDGHIGAFLYLEELAKKRQWLTENAIKKVQGLITEEQGGKRSDLKIPEKYIGNYRDVPVSVSGEERLPSSQIPCKMRGLISRVQYFQEGRNNRPELDNIASVADFYFDFEIYHPFYDGNGRTGRAIVFFLMSYLGREPFIFTDEEKYWMHFPALKHKERVILRKYFYEKSGLI